jgi:tRNA (cmo5U34)-methyltransferase
LSDARWSEETSELYRQLAQVAVPYREEQIATILSLLPFGKDEPFRAIELASGEGGLSHAILDSFPNARLLAMDYDHSMREQTAGRLRAFGDRAAVAPFDMLQDDWYGVLNGVDCVVSSLCIHHLSGSEKQALYRAVGSRLSAKGVFLIADLVAAQRPEANRVFATTWDKSAEAQSSAQTGSSAAYNQFVETHWNYYHFPDPFDKPSPLFDQLRWLHQSDFMVVDCFWMQAGHAIFGGYKSLIAHPTGETLTYEQALASSRRALAMS